MNRPPEAYDDAYSMDEETTLVKNILSNDRDADGDAIEMSGIVQAVTHGTLAWQKDGKITYRPAHNFHGEDRFVYEIKDSKGASDTATVTITVRNTAEIDARNHSFTMNEDTTFNGNLKNYVSNPLNRGLRIVSVNDNTTNKGKLTWNANGSFSFKPDRDWYGTAGSFTYTVNDGFGTQSTVLSRSLCVICRK